MEEAFSDYFSHLTKFSDSSSDLRTRDLRSSNASECVCTGVQDVTGSTKTMAYEHFFYFLLSIFSFFWLRGEP